MDELARRLREDAAKIDAEIPADLDRRIAASLVAAETSPRRAERGRGLSLSLWWLWWASSLTGIAAAAAVVLVLNLNSGGYEPVGAPLADMPPLLPELDLDVRPAMLTAPLQREFDNLRSDLEKAERAVREALPLSRQGALHESGEAPQGNLPESGSDGTS